jgi:hypothetical protein
MLHVVLLWNWPRALHRRCSKSLGLMYLCSKAIHVSRREGKARLSNKFWALHLVDTVAMWLKCNSAPPSRVDSRQTWQELLTIAEVSNMQSPVGMFTHRLLRQMGFRVRSAVVRQLLRTCSGCGRSLLVVLRCSNSE